MSIYKFIELVGTSTKSWEDAALAVLGEAGRSLDELRVAEVMRHDIVVAKGKPTFRVRLKLSFKYKGGEEDLALTEAMPEI